MKSRKDFKSDEEYHNYLITYYAGQAMLTRAVEAVGVEWAADRCYAMAQTMVNRLIEKKVI